MNIPIISPTTCPSVEELTNEFVIVIVARHPGFLSSGYLGRLTKEDAELGLVCLRDAFEYESGVQILGEGKTARAGRYRKCFPTEGFALDAIAVEPLAVIRLADVPPRIVGVLREELIQAWNGREHLRKVGSQVATTTQMPG